MIKEIIKGYNDTKLLSIKKLSGIDNNLFDETNFLDEGYIKSRIVNLKEEYKNTVNAVENTLKYNEKDDEYKKSSLSEGIALKDGIIFELAFLASNDLKQLDNSKKALEDMKSDFKLCLEGMIMYKNGDKEKAFEYLKEYFSLNDDKVINHYLANKIYSQLLIKFEEYELAIRFLRQVISLRPEDIETHKILYEIYYDLGKNKEADIEKNIISILE